MKKLWVLIFLTLAVGPFFASAQVSPTSFFTLETTHENPGPGDSIIAFVQSKTINLTKATLTWYLNDKIAQEGIGKTFYVFKNGVSGETTHLRVSINTNTGEFETQELSFTPVGFTILWEADTYTPPFYKGKAMMAPESKVRVFVVADSSNLPGSPEVDSFMYSWEKDGSTTPDLSGLGEKSFSFVGPKSGSDAKINIEISSLDNTIDRLLSLNLSLAKPFVLFYQDHSLLGMWYNSPFGDSITLATKEFSLRAEPYFFPSDSLGEPKISYSWSLNGKPLLNITRNITLRNEAGSQGDSLINLTVQGTGQGLLSATQALMVHFGVDNSSVRSYF